MSAPNADDLQQQITNLSPWFHNQHLPDGTQSAPDHFLGDFPSFKWRELSPHVPEDLTGWRALDIGCNEPEPPAFVAHKGIWHRR